MRPSSPVVEATSRLESAATLDGLVAAVARAARLLPDGAVDSWLRGLPVGHALHPFLTDLPIGFWASSLALDLRGRASEESAADALVMLGLLSSAPAAVTGLAEWRRLDRPDDRTGALHAALNGVAVALFGASLAARRAGARSTGVGLSVAATAVTAASGFLGGHLAIARKVGSRHPRFSES
jgi:uncharacterized membrane protein